MNPMKSMMLIIAAVISGCHASSAQTSPRDSVIAYFQEMSKKKGSANLPECKFSNPSTAGYEDLVSIYMHHDGNKFRNYRNYLVIIDNAKDPDFGIVYSLNIRPLIKGDASEAFGYVRVSGKTFFLTGNETLTKATGKRRTFRLKKGNRYSDGLPFFKIEYYDHSMMIWQSVTSGDIVNNNRYYETLE